MEVFQRFSALLTSSFEWIKERINATLTWLTQDRITIREELTQRMAEARRDPEISRATGYAMGSTTMRAVGDVLLRGGRVTNETRAQRQQVFNEQARQLSPEDQETLRDIGRLSAAGGFTEAELDEITREARQRYRSSVER
jgi:hypothetical protein